MKQMHGGAPHSVEPPLSRLADVGHPRGPLPIAAPPHEMSRLHVQARPGQHRALLKFMVKI